jgi:hypothetical protein
VNVTAFLAVLAVPFALVTLFFFDPVTNALRGHPFLHADLVHALANGALKPEESQLAGLAVGYPWGGHVMQAALSWTLGTSPVANYRWTNLLWLVAGTLLLAKIAGVVGGSLRARVLTTVWALFAVNAIGFVLAEFVASPTFSTQYPVLGDFSYTPLLRKYTLWNQHPFGHALFAGILFFLVHDDDVAFSKSAVLLMSVMAVGLAFIFPTFMPAVATALFARLVVDVYRRRSNIDSSFVVRRVRSLGAVGLVGGLATLATLWLVGEDRSAGTGLTFSSAWLLKTKSVEMLVVLSPLLAGAVLYVRARVRAAGVGAGAAVLIAAGLMSAALYVIVQLTHGIEYKLVFTAAMCLAPAAAVGVDRWLGDHGRARGGAYAVLVLSLVGASGYALVHGRPTGPSPFPIQLNEFRTQLPEGHSLTQAVRAIAQGTTVSTVIVVDSIDVHLPVFVERSLYAPPQTDEIMHGVEMRNRFILGTNRGYGYEIVDQRLAITKELFRAARSRQRLDALTEIMRLGRPIALLIDLSVHSGLLSTLRESGTGHLLHRDARWVVWLCEPGARGV